MSLINFAIIGCGRIAQRHAEHISKRGKLVAVCDIVPERANALAGQYGATPYYSLDVLLESEKNIDVAAICTPNGLHAAQSIMCLDAGINVLCEKPMGINVRECEAMIAASEKASKQLIAIKQNRFNPPV